MKVRIDGDLWDVCRVSDPGDGSGVSIFVKRSGSRGGPTAEHQVPQMRGKFRTNGHAYDFSYSVEGV